MKKIVFALVLAALLSVHVYALGEIGFAEIRKEQVNFRRMPGGERICYLDAPQSVFVTQEKLLDGQLWCRVNTFVGKHATEGWIRGDMLRFFSEEFMDVVSVQAGSHYATGLRRDGTVAIMGDDMPHLPCIDEVRTWGAIAQVTSSVCSVYALDTSGYIFTVGRNQSYGTEKAAKLSGNEPILLDEQGYIMPQTWDWNEETMGASAYYLTDGVGQERCIEALGYERTLYGVLTEDGRLLCVNEAAHLKQRFEHGPYRDADANWNYMIALRADGRVDAASRNAVKDWAACDIASWTDVVKVAAGTDHSLGLRADGTVYYAGSDAAHAHQVAQWTDVVDLDAGNGYSIALRKDGSVVMAGAYTSYDR